MQLGKKRPLFRAGDTHEGEVCRFRHPVYGWGFFAVEDNTPNLEKPLHWVDTAPDDPDDGSGYWIYAKEVF